MTGVDGQGILAFTSRYLIDATSPSVVSLTVNGVSVTGGETASDGMTRTEIVFSEELATAGLGAEDVVLTDTIMGASFTADSFDYNPATNTLTLTFGSLSKAITP